MAVNSYGSADHRGLSGLASSDDHPQYTLDSQGLLSARPATGRLGQQYYATDEGIVYRWTGSAWGVVGNNDHGLLTGLGDDDHPQYLLRTDGNAAYASKVEGGGSLSVSESTTSTSYTDLATAGPQVVHVAKSTSGHVRMAASIGNSVAGVQSYMSFEVVRDSDGAVIAGPMSANAIWLTNPASGRVGASVRVDGLTVGESYTVRAKYRVGAASTGTFHYRTLSVES